MLTKYFGGEFKHVVVMFILVVLTAALFTFRTDKEVILMILTAFVALIDPSMFLNSDK